MIRVAITDDHPLVLDGLKNTLSREPHIAITGTYCNGTDLLNGLYMERPDVLLLDMQLPGRSGSELIPHIVKHYPEIRILVLSSMESPTFIRNMMRCGSMGYLLKSTTDHQSLVKAIETVYNGDLYIDQTVREELFYGIVKARKRVKESSAKLTRREKEILRLITAEYNNQKIAELLCLSPRTVENHRYNLLQKLEVKNTAGLVKAALSMGLVD